VLATAEAERDLWQMVMISADMHGVGWLFQTAAVARAETVQTLVPNGNQTVAGCTMKFAENPSVSSNTAPSLLWTDSVDRVA